MKSTTQQIRMIEAKQPKVNNGGMPARNTGTGASVSFGKNDGSVNVKATVNAVLSRIKK